MSTCTPKERAEMPISYTAYGYADCAENERALRYAGEHTWGRTYLLGNGYRNYSPMLMRFFSPDEYSPFAQGGINAYAYCSGDPVNFSDSNGRVRTRIAHVPQQKKVESLPERPVGNVQPQPGQQNRQPAAEGNQAPRPANANYRARKNRTRHVDPVSRARYRLNVGLREGSIDPQINNRGRPTIKKSEAEILHVLNKMSRHTFKHLNADKSRLARFIVIESKLIGENPLANLRAAFPKMPNDRTERMAYSVDRHLAQIRSEQ
ncbi:RHS repeat-associated core domain-containing protein [Pseudomonas phoenicis]|uniref:RHS repeat-associated core domain-containing protein n=1 Tax=unclassified Pseudomonas TaxID=196821 RepID=UPI0039A0D08F